MMRFAKLFLLGCCIEAISVSSATTSCPLTFTYVRTHPGTLATEADLTSYCGTNCAAKFGLGEWERCGLADGMLQGPGYGGKFAAYGGGAAQNNRGCYIKAICTPSGSSTALTSAPNMMYGLAGGIAGGLTLALAAHFYAKNHRKQQPLLDS